MSPGLGFHSLLIVSVSRFLSLEPKEITPAAFALRMLVQTHREDRRRNDWTQTQIRERGDAGEGTATLDALAQERDTGLWSVNGMYLRHWV